MIFLSLAAVFIVSTIGFICLLYFPVAVYYSIILLYNNRYNVYNFHMSYIQNQILFCSLDARLDFQLDHPFFQRLNLR
jgi:hypothetical protein